MRIRIIKRPDGEAPEWVRDAWIGVELSALNEQPADMVGFGVLSGPKGRFGALWKRLKRQTLHYHGFCVSGPEALSGLEAKQPLAAKWWRENCPQLAEPGMGFLFRAAECESLPEPNDSTPFSNPWSRP